jgi:hypothetical protein
VGLGICNNLFAIAVGPFEEGNLRIVGEKRESWTDAKTLAKNIEAIMRIGDFTSPHSTNLERQHVASSG